ETDLARVSEDRDFASLKKNYTASTRLNFGPEEAEALKSLRLAKQGVNYEAPEREVVFQATLWDLPLIKSYLKHQGADSNSPVAEELRRQLLNDHHRATQILV